MRRILAIALLLGLIGGWTGDVQARGGILAGSWFTEVTPQPVPPDIPVPPPPFVSILNFGLAGTLVETDTSVNPISVVEFFPPEDFPPFTSSDGFGSWKWTGRHRYRCTFLKFLFDRDGAPIGILETTLDLKIKRDGTLEGEGESNFIRGTDPEGEVFFTGPVILEGARLKVERR